MASQADNESKAILSKSLYRIDKALTVLNRLDSSHFPTQSSEKARELLSRALKCLERNAPIDISSHTLYLQLFDLQKLVGIIEQSSDSRISWPIVSNCDKIWRSFFAENGPSIFYSLTEEYNYLLRPFSSELKEKLNPLLARQEIDSLIEGQPLYCLQLASSEDENLSLYAIIGHEFGHAIFEHNLQELNAPYNECFLDINSAIIREINSGNDSHTSRILSERVFRIIKDIAEELFCDLVGGMTMGPAFFLSSYEMYWGNDVNIWDIKLFPNDLSAYPSPNFRLSCLKKSIEIDAFCVELNKNLKIRESVPLGIDDLLKEIDVCMSRIPVDHDSDSIYISSYILSEPKISEHEKIIKDILKSQLVELKNSFQRFLDRSQAFLKDRYPDSFPDFKACDIVQLLIRFEQKILPNIIPKKNSLLGLPAPFSAILNASALYRFKVLIDKSKDKNLKDLTSLVERLTTKAFEVSFMQEKYNEENL